MEDPIIELANRITEEIVEQINQIKDKCDGIIIGSKILNIILDADSLSEGLRELEKFCMEIKMEL